MRRISILALFIGMYLFTAHSYAETAGDKSLLQKLAAEYEKSTSLANMEKELAALEPYLEEAIRQNDEKEEMYARISKVYCYYNFDMYDLLYEEIDRQMEYFSKRGWWDQYYVCANTKVEALIFQNKPASALREADRLYIEASRSKLPVAFVMAAYNLFICYHLSGYDEEAARIFEQDILSNYKDIPSGSESNYYAVYNEVLAALQRYDDLLKHCAWIESNLNQKLEMYQKNGVAYNSNTNLHYLYYGYAEAYLGLGEIDKAESYYQKVLTVARSFANSNADLSELHSRILQKQGAYKEALEEINKALDNADVSDNQSVRCYQLARKADILHQAGVFAESSGIYRQVVELKDSISRSDLLAQLNDLRSIYEFDRITHEKDIAHSRLLIALLLCGAMAVVLVIYVIYSRRLKMKNRILVGSIQKQTYLEQERRAKEKDCKPMEQTADISVESELFIRFRDLLFTEKLHLTPEFGRDLVLEHLGTNKNKLNEMVFAATGCNLIEYVTKLRLQEALLVMESEPDLPFALVAEQSGFGNYSSFYRSFYKQYGVNPTDYKKYRNKKT